MLFDRKLSLRNAFRNGTTCLITVWLFAALLVPAAMAQPTTPSKSTDADKLDFFDSDTEKTEMGWDQLSVSLGAMWLEASGKYSVRLPSGKQITILDLDRIGLGKDDTTHWLTVNWRSRNSRWGAWFGTWQYDKSGFRIWEDELNLGDDLVIPIGASITTEMTTDWYIFEATYSFIRSETVDLGIGFGIHAVELDAKLTGRVEIGESSGELINTKIDTLAPLPNVLGYVHWKFAPDWRITARYGWFGLSYDDYDGQMTNLHALLRYDFSRRWAMEAGYQFLNLDLDVDEREFTSVFDLDFKGPLAVVRFNF